jgi:hypothetical protein
MFGAFMCRTVLWFRIQGLRSLGITTLSLIPELLSTHFLVSNSRPVFGLKVVPRDLRYASKVFAIMLTFVVEEVDT